MALLFSHVRVSTPDGNEAEFLVSGIPRELDDFDYLYTNTHDAIISVDKFEAVQSLLEDKRHGMRGGLHIMQVIDMGVFQGYVPINHHWVNDVPTHIMKPLTASERRVKHKRYAVPTSAHSTLQGIKWCEDNSSLQEPSYRV